MFTAAAKEKSQAVPSAAGSEKEGNQTTVISKGALVEGKFKCSENVRLDGAIHGEVNVEKRLVIGDSGVVKGNIHARDAVIKGRITGDVFIAEALHLTETAVIDGNITARIIVVEEGARYNGSCKIGTGN